MSKAMDQYQRMSALYKKELQEGFRVVDTRQYYADGTENTPRVESWMMTPYQFEGKPVMGYAVTNVKDDQRPSDTMEFWQDGRNVEDIAASKNMAVSLTDKDGKPVDYQAARERIGAFASGGSYYPHVFTYDEYVEARKPVNERLKMDPPDARAYGVYLDSVERQLMSRDFHFVGSITTPAELEESNLRMFAESSPSAPQKDSDFSL